jgi:hypothetical protein
MDTSVQTMMKEHVTVEADRVSFSRRFNPAAQARLKAPAKGEPKEDQNQARTWPATTQLRLMDLNLFRVFDAMMLHRSVRKASQTLSVTPSEVSHALGRLRQSIGDELFISTESGMQPTRRALELASAVREGLEKLASALARTESVPAEAARTFRIGATDYACMVILPALVKRLAKSAPNVDLQVFSSNHLDLLQQLEKGRAGPEGDGSDGTPRGHQRRVRPNARRTDRGARRARLRQLTRRLGISKRNAQYMKTYYAIVNVEDRRLGIYVPAENVAAAFETATARYKTRHPRLHVETIAVQEIAEEVQKVT